MADLCFLCNKSDSGGESLIEVVRGMKSLRTASVERNDGKIDYLKSVTSVKVHEKCRSVYISKNCIQAAKRKQEEGETITSPLVLRKKRGEVFDFKKQCLFCGEVADEAAEKKKREKYRRKIKNVSTLEFKDTVIKKAEERGDDFGELVKSRIILQYDLIAAEAKYHAACFTNFSNKSSSSSPLEKPRQDNQVTEAMLEIFNYIENNNDSQFTLKELKDVLTGYVPDDKTIITRLQQKYLTDIVITKKVGAFTIISFRDAQANILSKAWYESKKIDPEAERLRIVEAAAAIIREDIRTSIVETKSYPPPSKMLDNVNQEIPKTLLHFLEEVIVKNRKGQIDHLKTKCTSISHAIMAAIRERSFSSQLLLSLSVFLHRRYGSKRLLDILSSLGFAASYSNTVQYEVSAVYHPHPRILSSESGALVQYVGDNADINVQTLDGNNTLHVMGIIKIVTPKNAVLYDERIQKCTTKPKAKELAAISHVSLQVYDKPVVPGYSKVQVENLHDGRALTEKTINGTDFLWLYGKWRDIASLPGWNGYLEQLTKNEMNFSTSQVMFLPFIDHPASNVDTIYTTLLCALDIAKSHGQKTCVITFDQPLYSKAREMVAASDSSSNLCKVVVKLGGFHMLMSFLGSMGYIMDGSGLKEALGNKIYAPNSVDKMLSGHAYSRSTRGHILVRLALSKIIFEDMKIEDGTLDELIQQITSRDVSYSNVEGYMDNSNIFLSTFLDKLDDLKARGPTAQLWVQYFEMVTIALDFVRAERLGLFQEHLDAVRRMLPYFHASGHFLYAKSAHLYLQDMLKLEETMDEQTYENFRNGFFTVKRTEKYNSGTWTDMVIEQSLMKSMKTEGGVSRGRSTKESVLCKWVYAMYATNTICEEMEKFCNISLESTEQHVDSRDSRVKKDNADVNILFDWFKLHDPFPNTTQLISIASGIVGNEQINCHRAYEIGLESMKKITGLSYNEIKLKRSEKVMPLSSVNKSVKINDCKVAVDPLLLFQRITVSKQFESNLEEYLQYELSPYPTALFDNDGMRKTTKSSLYDNMSPIDFVLNENNVTFIIDGGFLLHHVVWSREDTFSIIFDKYMNYLQRHYSSKIIVVFDGYSDNSKNVKAMEQQRRTAALSKTYEVCFDETMVVPVTQEKFLSNRNNKDMLINMLIEKLQAGNITTKQARDDADVLIVETAIEESKSEKTAVIIGQDIDLLVILIGRTLSYEQEIFLKKVGKGNVKTEIYSTKSFDNYPHSKTHILFLHALSGCDTTSALFKKGKKSLLKVFEKLTNLDELAAAFEEENCSAQRLLESGTQTLLAVYNAPKSVKSLDHLRYMHYVKSTKLNKPVQLSNIPPTSAAAHQHFKRVYYQVQTWLGHDLEPQVWGWAMRNDFLEPIMTILPPAPEDLLNTIFCNCKSGCGSRCGCRKAGLQCSLACGQCNGQACLNALPYQSDINEDGTFDPEIMEELETNVVEDDNEDQFEIYQQPEDDDEEEEDD